MAVPPLAAKLIIEAVLKTFARVQYEHIEASLQNVLVAKQPRLLEPV
jgi:hypothetical protein